MASPNTSSTVPTRTILDADTGTAIDLDRIANGDRSLAVHKVGLFMCYQTMRSHEQQAQLRSGTRVEWNCGTTLEIGSRVCYFNWYAVTLRNLLSLISLYHELERRDWRYAELLPPHPGAGQKRKKIRAAFNQYLDTVPEARPINQWRNKVAAHPAGANFGKTRGKEPDSASSLYNSLLAEVAYCTGRYVAGSVSFSLRAPRNRSIEVFPRWSLTKNWESLRSRYQLNELGDLQQATVPAGASVEIDVRSV